MDVDIDLKSDFDPLTYFNVIPASKVNQKGQLVRHPAGAYFQNIPVDTITGLSAIPFKEAEDLGYFKIDFLHLTMLNNFENKREIRALLSIEPDWAKLEDQSIVEKLFQIHNHFDVVYEVKPKSVQELADTIALIRPAKRKFLHAYVKKPSVIRKKLYERPEDGKYYFKKSHAIAYALTIVLELHLA